MEIYLDDWGLPVTKNMDGGDSVHEAGMLMALDPYHVRFDMKLYLPKTGPQRHPDSKKWYGRPHRFSRDALIALQCGFIMHPNYHEERKTLYEMHKRMNFILAWNTIKNFVYEDEQEHKERSTPDVEWMPTPKTPDPCGFEVQANWIRMFWREKTFWQKCKDYVKLCFYDLETLFGGIQWNWREDNLSRNHLLVCFVSTSVVPTPISWLARWATPVEKLIIKWDTHARKTDSIIPTELFRMAFKR